MNQHQINLIDAIIIHAVKTEGPIKAVDLASWLVEAAYADPEIVPTPGSVLAARIYDLAKKGRIVEIEYTLPGENLTKSIFLPLGTAVNVVVPD